MIAEVLFVALIVVLFLINVSKKPRGMPPGEWGWPVIGHIPSRKILWVYQVEALKQKHGKIFSWRIGSRNFVFICDYKIFKSVFATVEASYRPNVFSLHIFTKFKGIGLATSCGKSSQNIRRFLLKYLKESGMRKSSMEDIIVYELQCVIADFKAQMGKPVQIPWSVNVAVTNILWKFIADKRFDVCNAKMQAFERLIGDIFHDGQNPVVAAFDFFPYLNHIVPDSLKCKLGLAKLLKNIDEYSKFIDNEIDEHLKILDVDNPRDFIDLFLVQMKATEARKEPKQIFNFAYKELRFTLSELFFAGSETTSSAVRWVILFLAKYPEVQRKVQEEIDNAVPREKLPAFQDKEKFVYTQAVINEVLRLMPIGPFGLYHNAGEDISVEGFYIPKDTILVPSIFSCHLDPDYWEDPTAFIPERFITPEGTLETNKEGYLPFSSGRRSCLGETIARMNLFFFTVGFFQKFAFSAPEGVDLKMVPDKQKNFFMVPSFFEIVITERD